tara:strand:- start:4844 stop:5197 length:354 start_codon:yes stop_codon:yes gene_type:complete
MKFTIADEDKELICLAIERGVKTAITDMFDDGAGTFSDSVLGEVEAGVSRATTGMLDRPGAHESFREATLEMIAEGVKAAMAERREEPLRDCGHNWVRSPVDDCWTCTLCKLKGAPL